MTHEELLDRSLGLIDDPEEPSAFLGLMTATPRSEDDQRIVQLRQSIDRMLSDDGDDLIPPAGLVDRTLANINAPRTISIQDLAPIRVPFRWADFAVAASIFLAGLLTLAPAVQRSKQHMAQLGCALNLRQLGSAILSYGTIHQTSPLVPIASDVPEPAGTFLVLLRDGGLLSDPKILDCPANGDLPRARPRFPILAELSQMLRQSPEGCLECLRTDYAFEISQRRIPGGGMPPTAVAWETRVRLPIAADTPSFEPRGQIFEGNSPNHSGHGQNVLFGDGHVEWLSTRFLDGRDKDIYLNEDSEIAPGLNSEDVVLVPSMLPVRIRAR